MTRLVADSEHMDHVTILLARVCAARLDTGVPAEEFVRMVARLVDVAVAEAIEDHEEDRSTGAAAVVQTAAQTNTAETAARETPAAPSKLDSASPQAGQSGAELKNRRRMTPEQLATLRADY